MRMSQHDIPVRFEVPGVTVRQVPEFGSSPGGKVAGEFFSLATGTETAPLLHGLTDDACQFSPTVEHGHVLDHMLARLQPPRTS